MNCFQILKYSDLFGPCNSNNSAQGMKEVFVIYASPFFRIQPAEIKSQTEKSQHRTLVSERHYGIFLYWYHEELMDLCLRELTKDFFIYR